MNRDAANSIDGEIWEHYGENLEANFEDLSRRLKQGPYRVKPVKRLLIAKPAGLQRPLSVTALPSMVAV
jgi:retron-type reverse transcriptase